MVPYGSQVDRVAQDFKRHPVLEVHPSFPHVPCPLDLFHVEGGVTDILRKACDLFIYLLLNGRGQFPVVMPEAFIGKDLQ